MKATKLRRMVTVSLVSCLGLCLTQCKPANPGPGPGPAALSRHPYSVDFKFSTAAAKAMLDAKDTITVSALYYGDPKPAETADADSLGRIKLGDEENAAVASSHEVRMAGEFDASKLALIRDDPSLLINAFSTTPVGNPDGLLFCHSWIGLLKQATLAPPLITCGTDEDDLDKLDGSASSSSS